MRCGRALRLNSMFEWEIKAYWLRQETISFVFRTELVIIIRWCRDFWVRWLFREIDVPYIVVQTAKRHKIQQLQHLLGRNDAPLPTSTIFGCVPKHLNAILRRSLKHLKYACKSKFKISGARQSQLWDRRDICNGNGVRKCTWMLAHFSNLCVRLSGQNPVRPCIHFG